MSASRLFFGVMFLFIMLLYLYVYGAHSSKLSVDMSIYFVTCYSYYLKKFYILFQTINQDTSTCLLWDIWTSNRTNSAVFLQRLCSQPKYDNLTTCMLWDLTTATNIFEASVVANNLCQHHIISNSSLCSMLEIQQRLMAILVTVDPREVS